MSTDSSLSPAASFPAFLILLATTKERTHSDPNTDAGGAGMQPFDDWFRKHEEEEGELVAWSIGALVTVTVPGVRRNGRHLKATSRHRDGCLNR